MIRMPRLLVVPLMTTLFSCGTTSTTSPKSSLNHDTVKDCGGVPCGPNGTQLTGRTEPDGQVLSVEPKGEESRAGN